MESIGMKQPRLIIHNGDVALPEHEIAAPQAGGHLRGRERLPDGVLLHVAVARAGYATGGERDLQEARAVDAEIGLATPKVRAAEEPLGNRDEVGFVPSTVDASAPSKRETASREPNASDWTGASLIDGPGKTNVRSALTLWVGIAPGLRSAALATKPT